MAGPNPAAGQGVPLPARTAPREPSAMPPSAAAAVTSVAVPIVMPCPAAVAMVPAAAVPAVRAGKSDRATNRHEHCRKQTSHFFILKNVCSSTRYKHSSGDDVNRRVFRRRDRDRYRLGFRRRRRCAAGPFGDELIDRPVVYVDVASRVDARDAAVSGILPQPPCRPACLTLRRRTVLREPKTRRAKKRSAFEPSFSFAALPE